MHASLLEYTCIHTRRLVLGECEKEKIIPRESVLRSRLEPNLAQDRGGSKGGELRHAKQVAYPKNISDRLFLDHHNFESWLRLVDPYITISGQSPQRVIWGKNNEDFDCADFFQPQERFTLNQIQSLLSFLQGKKLDGACERGRYGFATYLSESGPFWLRPQPRGYVVEVVQLLLNSGILSFKKGVIRLTAKMTSSSTRVQLPSNERDPVLEQLLTRDSSSKDEDFKQPMGMGTDAETPVLTATSIRQSCLVLMPLCKNTDSFCNGLVDESSIRLNTSRYVHVCVYVYVCVCV
jgi:hypothetical protein